MGFFEKLKQILRFNKEDEALQIDSNRQASASNRLNNRSEALESAPNFTDNEEEYDEKQLNEEISRTLKPLNLDVVKKTSEPIELQKESLQLGVAAGYTGRAIREIESSLLRIETQMASKDWLLSVFGSQNSDVIKELIEIKNVMERHDSITLKRFESIEGSLSRVVLAAKDAPEPLKQKIISEVESIRASLPLTSKMKQIMSIVKESKQISYDDLALKLGISRSALRGLLSNTMKRTDEIDRYPLDGKGWVRYKYPKTTQIPNFP